MAAYPSCQRRAGLVPEYVPGLPAGTDREGEQLAIPVAKLTAALFRETSPCPLKYALSLLGLMSPKVRLPLVEVTNETKAQVASVVAQICDRYPDDVVAAFGGSARAIHKALAG